MSIAARLPGLTLPELTRLHANAARLAAGAPGKTRDDAAALLPLLEAEIAARRDGKKRVVEAKPSAPRALRPVKPRAAREPVKAKSAAEKADDFLADVNAAINRR
ncbi:MAG: hypothetical protein IT548_03840 [Alphaproteobacteria bacterium]|nr:hypothetical protein [Alphaproteobacteria bacterium]